MLIYKISRTPELGCLAGRRDHPGAPIDPRRRLYPFLDRQSKARRRRQANFAGVEGLWLIAVEADGSRRVDNGSRRGGGALFQHLYRPLLLSDVRLGLALAAGGPRGHIFSRGHEVSAIERAGLALLRGWRRKRAHGLALKGSTPGWCRGGGPHYLGADSGSQLFGIHLPNPVGMAPAFDKNAGALEAIHARAGFGFVEWRHQRRAAGGPIRAAAVPADRGTGARHNRFGFNNEVMEAIGRRRRAHRAGGRGSTSARTRQHGSWQEISSLMLRHCGPFADFATVNVVPRRIPEAARLQGRGRSRRSRAGDDRECGACPAGCDPLEDRADTGPGRAGGGGGGRGEHGSAGIIAPNTTLSRDGLNSRDRRRRAAVGQPLFEMSTAVAGLFVLGGRTCRWWVSAASHRRSRPMRRSGAGRLGPAALYGADLRRYRTGDRIARGFGQAP